MLPRSVASRSYQLANVQLRSRTPQKRCKTFTRKEDGEGQTYFVITPRKERGTPPAVKLDKLFEMPDLLLDLDAEDSTAVRSYNAEDEMAMQDEYGADPKRAAVRARLDNLKNGIYNSRETVSRVISDATSPWRITSHDVMSAAVRGGSEDMRAVGSSDHGKAYESSLSYTAFATTKTLCVENGIPDHAIGSDTLLLWWMMLRREQIQQSSHHRVPSPKVFLNALEKQTSIAGIRRLVYQSLIAGLKPSMFETSASEDGPHTFERKVRNACLEVIGRSEFSSAVYAEALIFIGNLIVRFQETQEKSTPVLGGFALKLSADAAVIESTSEHFYFCSSLEYFAHSSEATEDAISALERYVYHLEEGQTKSLQAVSGRQLLFQTLTGLDGDRLLSPTSVRLTAFPSDKKLRTMHIRQFTQLYYSYITLLGQLGAVRTLWREWKDSARSLAKRHSARVPAPEQNTADEIAGVFLRAIAHSLDVAAISQDTATSDLDLAACVTLDYHSIDTQNPEKWHGKLEAHDECGLTVERVKTMLDKPLNQFLTGYKKLLSERSGQP